MKFISWFLLVFLLINIAGCQKHKEINFITQWDSVRVLENPHKGWYHHLLDNGIDGYAIRNDSIFRSFPGMDHVYIRIAWSYLEPAEGQYDWHLIDEAVDKYVPLGYGISFRITGKETGIYPGSVGQQHEGVQYATPFWVRKAGAKGTVATAWNIQSWVPDWDDPVYLKKLDRFHQAFAARYDGKPWLRYVDIGSIGEWGEGHTSFSTKIPPTLAEVKANIDVYLKNYKISQLVCTDDLIYYGKSDNDVKSLLDYATAKGLTLRDDSPMVDWYLQQNLNTWSVSHPNFFDPVYLKKPVIFELQHYGMVKEDGNWLGRNGSDTIPKYGYPGAEIMRNAIKTLHATYLGYHGYAEEWLADNPDLTRELVNLCGYWYFPVSATLPRIWEKKENKITICWLNKGVAPAYQPFGIQFRFTGAPGQPSMDIMLEDAGNRSWLPQINSPAEYVLPIPGEIQKGKYYLHFRLVYKTGSSIMPLDIGLAKESVDSNGFVSLGTIQVR